MAMVQLSFHFCKVICKRAKARQGAAAAAAAKAESKCRQNAVKDETAKGREGMKGGKGQEAAEECGELTC